MTPQSMPASGAEVAVVQRWRRSVVRLWIATMLVAIAVWALLAATRVPWLVELGLAAALALLTGSALWKMRRGACPRCGGRIRFQPRIELPRACPHCAAPFFARE
jgi:hypothetical protein